MSEETALLVEAFEKAVGEAGATWDRCTEEVKAHLEAEVERTKSNLLAAILAGVPSTVGAGLRIVFDGPPNHVGPRFVEVEDANGNSVRAGEWHDRPDGLCELRLFPLNAAAEILMPVEGAGLREAAKLALDVLTWQVAEASKCGDPNYECPMQDIHGADDEHQIARSALLAALASPQPAVEGPIAAGKLPFTAEVGEAADHYLKGIAYNGEYHLPARCRFSDLFDVMQTAALLFAPATPTPPADPKPTVPGNDAGMREALIRLTSLEPLGGFSGDYDELAARVNFARAALTSSTAPQTGSAGEDPKTPDATKPGAYVTDWDAEFREAHANQPPKAETPAGVGKRNPLLDWRGAVEGWDESVIAATKSVAQGRHSEKLTDEQVARSVLWVIGLDRLWEHVKALRAALVDRQTPEVAAALRTEADRLLNRAAALSAAPAARPGDEVERETPAEAAEDLIETLIDAGFAAAPAADGGRA